MNTRAMMMTAALLCAAAACSDDPVPSASTLGEANNDPAECGDDACDPGEDADTCPEDCEAANNEANNVPGPMQSCQRDEDCDDGLDCTEDRCDGNCVWTLADDACLIGGACQSADALNPRSSCLRCAPVDDLFAWSPLDDGSTCDDGNACTDGETCRGGACEGGAALVCDDGDPCTMDGCDPERGCTSAAGPDGVACDDGDPCTQDDACAAGACAGRALLCDDDNPCTDDACGEDGQCVHTNNEAPCDDGDACTRDDTCADGACGSGEAVNCDDGNICTIDGCDPLAGCYRLPTENPCCIGETSVCDDGNPCTSDLCDPESGDCLYEDNAAACDDGSACTANDECARGQCGGLPVICDDGNDCTEDRCNDTLGCVTIDLDGVACDDGVACTTDDACVAGACLGDDEACVCSPEFGQTAAKFSQVSFAPAGEGLDLNGDDSPDNQLGVAGILVNEPLQGALDGGDLILLVDFIDFDQNPFVLAAHEGRLALDNPDCDLQSAACDYDITESLLDRDTCEPLVTLSGSLEGQTLRAGGQGSVFPLQVPFGEGVLALTIYEVRIEGELTVEDGQVTAFNGVLAGAVIRAELVEALGQLPPGTLPFEPDAIANLLDLVIMDDVDIDDDGTPDAASLALNVDALGARLVGVRR